MADWQALPDEPGQAAQPAAGAAPPSFDPLISQAESQYKIPSGLLRQLLETESGLDPSAHNASSGATGIAQIEPATAAKPGYGLQPYTQLGNPASDIDFAGQYLAARYKEAGSWLGAIQGYGTLGQSPENPGQQALWAMAQGVDKGSGGGWSALPETAPAEKVSETGGVTQLDYKNPLAQPFYEQGPDFVNEVKSGWEQMKEGWDNSIKSGIVTRGMSALDILAGAGRIGMAPFTALGKAFIFDPFERTSGIKGSSDFLNTAAQTAAGFFGPVAEATDAVSALRDTKLAQDVLKAVSPTSLGPEAARGERALRLFSSRVAHDSAMVNASMERFEGTLGRLSAEAQLDVIHRMETGEGQLTPELQAAADHLHALLDGRWERVNSVGLLDAYRENYVPHQYKDPNFARTALSEVEAEKEAELRSASKRPLKGDQSWRKQRVFATVREAMAWAASKGKKLELVTTNPLRLAAIRIRQMDHAYNFELMKRDLKADGHLEFVRGRGPGPAGFSRLEDKSFEVWRPPGEGETGPVKTGEYWAPEPLARLVNNYTSRGLKGIWDPMSGSIGMALRGGSNLLNMTQLGWSLFHLMFTINDAFYSRMALGFQQLSKLDPRGVVTVATSPFGFARNLVKGSKLRQAYRNPLGPPPDDEMAPVLDMLIRGGGRVQMDEIHKILQGQPVWRKIVNGTILADLKSEAGSSLFKQAFEGGRQLLKLAFEPITEPLMTWWVPRQKLGVFYDMSQDFLRRNPGASALERQVAAIRMWDTVDDRMGQMVYDNLFWNKTGKDLAFLSVRSLGWNLGDVRALGGAVLDAYGNVKHLSHLELKKLELTPRLSYAAAMTVGHALESAILTYLYTGKGPQELMDYMFAWNGKYDDKGNKQRVSIPDYMKDVVAFAHDPQQTVMNKVNPMASMLYQWWTNRDYYGALIDDPDDPLDKRIWDQARWVWRNVQPFSMQSIQRLEQTGAPSASAWVSSVFGFQAAPGYIVDPAAAQAGYERSLRGPRMKKAREDAAAAAAPPPAPAPATGGWEVLP